MIKISCGGVKFLLDGGSKQRAFRIGSIGITVFHLADDAVKNYFVFGENNHDIARAVLFLVERKFNNRGVSVFLCNGIVLKKIGVKTYCITKKEF